MDKEKLLEALSFLDRDTLFNLYEYSRNIMIPEDDLLVNVNMKQMLDKAMELADKYFPEWTDRGIADFGRFLIENMCLLSEKDFYYINAFGNESLLSKMSIYSDAFLRSVELGYMPIVTRSAYADFKLTVDPTITDLTIDRGALVIDLIGTDFSFTNVEPIEVKKSDEARYITVKLHQGKWLSEQYRFNGFDLRVYKENIDTDSVQLSVSDRDWIRLRTFGQSNKNSRHFMILPEDRGNVVVMFGDNGYGYRPKVNENMDISYLITAGAKGNGLSGACSVNKYPSNIKVSGVAIIGESLGGSNADTLGDLKFKSSNHFFNNYTLNNKESVENWLKSQYEVRKSSVVISNNFIEYRVVPKNGSMAENFLLDILKERMQPLVTGGYYASPKATDYVDIKNIEVQCFFQKGFKNEQSVAKIRELIEDYTNPGTLADYGRGFLKEEITRIILGRIAGVENVLFTLIGTSSADVKITSQQILKKVPTSKIAVFAYEN